jgi:hypothetical protein
VDWQSSSKNKIALHHHDIDGLFDNSRSIHEKLIGIVPIESHEDGHDFFGERQEFEMRRLHLSFGGDVVLKYINLDAAALASMSKL